MGARGVMALLVAGLVGACDIGAAPSGGGDGRGRDAGGSFVDAIPYESPGELTIRVRNDSERALYVQASGYSRQEVLRIMHPSGEAIGHDTCETCNCSTCMQGCAVCGRAPARVAELVPGATHDVVWDQVDWRRVDDVCGAPACEFPFEVPPGTLNIRTRYSESYVGSLTEGESEIGTALTLDTTFEHPAPDVVIVSLP